MLQVQAVKPQCVSFKITVGQICVYMLCTDVFCAQTYEYRSISEDVLGISHEAELWLCSRSRSFINLQARSRLTSTCQSVLEQDSEP